MTAFPELNKPDVVFPVLKREEIRQWVKEAEQADYDKRVYTKMAGDLFFNGGTLVPKSDLPEKEFKAGSYYLQLWLGSWDPKHEEKELVAGYILSRIAQPEAKCP